MSRFKGFFIRIQEGPNVLEGYLLFISKAADIDLIQPHESILKDKLANISSEIKRAGMVKQPLLCFSDELKSPPNPCMQKKFSYHKNDVEVIVFCSQVSSEVIINEPFYLADGHHRLAALSQADAFASVNNVPIFLASSKSIKVEPFVHCQNLDSHNLYLLNKKFVNKELEQKGIYLSKIYFNGVVKDIYLNGLEKIVDLQRSVFNKVFPIDYMNYSKFEQLVSIGDLDLINKVCLQYPTIGKGEICEMSKKGFLLPEHSTYFYPKLPDNIIDLVMGERVTKKYTYKKYRMTQCL